MFSFFICLDDLLLKFHLLDSPVHPITNVVPLSLVLLVSLVKEAFEDWVSSEKKAKYL